MSNASLPAKARSPRFKVGDMVIGVKAVSRKRGPFPSRVTAGMIGTVIDEAVRDYNLDTGCDMVLRLIDGRVGAACSLEWKLLNEPSEVVEQERFTEVQS